MVWRKMFGIVRKANKTTNPETTPAAATKMLFKQTFGV